MAMVTRGVAIALVLESIWLGVGGALLPIAFELTAFEEENRGQGINGWVLGLGNFAISLVIALAGIRLLAVGARGLGATRWLGLAGLANLVLAAFWMVMFAGQDTSSGTPFLAIVVAMAAVCLGLAWTHRPVTPTR